MEPSPWRKRLGKNRANDYLTETEAAGHLKKYIKDVIIGVMIPATKEAINLFADETKYYVYGMYNLDKCLHVKVEEDYFPDLTYRLNGVLGETMDTLAACRTVLDSIYDILPLEPKSTEAMEDAFEGLYNMENNVQNSFTDYLEEFTLRAGRINDAMSGAYTLVSERAMGDIRMDEYEGTYRNDASLEDFRRELADVRADIGHTDDAKAAMETIQAEVQQLYDMEEFAEDQLMYIGGIAVGAVSMIVAPWATAPLLSFASGALATLYSVDQTDQGNQMYDAVQNWDVGVEIHPIVEIKNPALNMMYHITGSMALDYSLAMDLQAGNRFMKWWENMDGPGMPDNVNIAEDVWKLDAEDVNPLNDGDDVASVNTEPAGQGNAGGVTHLDDAENVTSMNIGCTPQQANAGGVTHLDDAENVTSMNIGCTPQQANAGGVTHLDDAEKVAGVSAGRAKQQVNAGYVTHLDDAENVAGVSAGRAKQQVNAGGVTHLDDAENVSGVNVGHVGQQVNEANIKGGSKTIDDIIDSLPETTNGKGVARNFESTGGFDQTIKDFDSLNPIDVKEIQTQYGPGKVGKLSDGTTVVARPGSTTGGATLEIRVSNSKVYKIRY